MALSLLTILLPLVFLELLWLYRRRSAAWCRRKPYLWGFFKGMILGVMAVGLLYVVSVPRQSEGPLPQLSKGLLYSTRSRSAGLFFSTGSNWFS